MTIAPIIKTVTVRADPALAFDLFARRMGDWWPKGGGVGKEPCVDVIIEPRSDGRWYERDGEGTETEWGRVLVWDPPHKLLLAWQIGPDWVFDSDIHTEVLLTFDSDPNGGTLVRLEHRRLEGFGARAPDLAAQLRGGWSPRIDQFAAFATTQTTGDNHG